MMLNTQKLKQNKKILTISTALFLLFSIVAIPVSATDISDIDSVTVPIVTYATQDSVKFSESLPACTLTYSSGTYIYSLYQPGGGSWTTGDVYAGVISNRIYCLSSTRGVTVNRITKSGSSYSDSTSLNTNTSYSSSFGTYYYGIVSDLGSYTSVSFSLPTFSSLDDFISAVENYTPPPPPPSGHSVTYDVPYGNALILEISGLSGQGTIIAQASGPSFNFYSSVSGGMFTTLPDSVQYPMSGLVQYSWDGSGPTDTSGRYSYFATTFSYNAQDISDNSYYIIVNPPFTAGVAIDYVLNSSITVSASNVSSFQIVPLNTQVTYGGNQTSIQDGDGGTGSYDPDTGNWNVTDENGDPYAPVDGGTDLPDQPTMSIHDYLQNIANTISGFFKGAVGAISTLVSAGSAFMRQLSSLYSWLPAPVYSVLTAALILVITIGVVKVLL